VPPAVAYADAPCTAPAIRANPAARGATSISGVTIVFLRCGLPQTTTPVSVLVSGAALSLDATIFLGGLRRTVMLTGGIGPATRVRQARLETSRLIE
jgi:hypothetical protein